MRAATHLSLTATCPVHCHPPPPPCPPNPPRPTRHHSLTPENGTAYHRNLHPPSPHSHYRPPLTDTSVEPALPPIVPLTASVRLSPPLSPALLPPPILPYLFHYYRLPGLPPLLSLLQTSSAPDDRPPCYPLPTLPIVLPVAALHTTISALQLSAPPSPYDTLRWSLPSEKRCSHYSTCTSLYLPSTPHHPIPTHARPDHILTLYSFQAFPCHYTHYTFAHSSNFLHSTTKVSLTRPHHTPTLGRSLLLCTRPTTFTLGPPLSVSYVFTPTSTSTIPTLPLQPFSQRAHTPFGTDSRPHCPTARSPPLETNTATTLPLHRNYASTHIQPTVRLVDIEA
ncbi:hypothetical protein CesoFtcFv8_013422 [Champsocephalus esox]|uniref:Uncharacterized protein n=1 Tax=Champsocephalus esox TaxID=159716 RepID=A0AAN8BRJ6_9TELE|nr:hypothetical protein CesoFtcFv8_013422 [Champsocephalus esox]